MPRYSKELKEQIVRKMMPPNSQSVAQISRDSGIATPTLYAWRNHYRAQGYIVPATSKDPEGWGWKDKAAAVLNTQSMNAAELSQYCREHGLYPEQLQAWQEAFEQTEGLHRPASKAQTAATRKKLKELEKELRRKDRALAETAALLVLSKKVQAIWGDKEED